MDTGWGTLTLDGSYLHGDESGEFQTFPGIYYNLDGKDTVPVVIGS